MSAGMLHYSMKYLNCVASRTILESHKESWGSDSCSPGSAVFHFLSQFLQREDNCFCGEGVAGLPQPWRPARPGLETSAWGMLDGGQRHECFCIGLSSDEVLDLPLLLLCHQGHLWGSTWWWWWAFRCYDTCPNIFAFPVSPAELQADVLGGRWDSLEWNATQGWTSASLRFLSCERRRVSHSYGQFRKNKYVSYCRKSLNRQYYGNMQSIAFHVLMSLSCAFLDMNAGRVCDREVLCIYSFALPVHVSTSTYSLPASAGGSQSSSLQKELNFKIYIAIPNQCHLFHPPCQSSATLRAITAALCLGHSNLSYTGCYPSTSALVCLSCAGETKSIMCFVSKKRQHHHTPQHMRSPFSIFLYKNISIHGFFWKQ